MSIPLDKGKYASQIILACVFLGSLLLPLTAHLYYCKNKIHQQNFLKSLMLPSSKTNEVMSDFLEESYISRKMLTTGLFWLTEFMGLTIIFMLHYFFVNYLNKFSS